MNLMGLSTISSYTRNLTLEMKWNQRKQTPVKEQGPDSQIAQFKRWAEDQMRSQAISSIYGKMMSGSYLTKEELEYLRVNSPENYEKAMQAQMEREEYKKQLKNFRSKEEVEQINQRTMNRYLCEARAIVNNPNIPKAQKLEKLEFLTMRMNAVIKEHTEFKNTEAYRRLPEKTEDANRASVSYTEDIATEEKILMSDTGNEPTDPLEYINKLLAEVFEAQEPDVGEATPEAQGETAITTSPMKITVHAYNDIKRSSWNSDSVISVKV